MSGARWLLLLGSNLADDRRMREALARLNDLGAATALTPTQRFPAQDGLGGAYFNALVELACDQSREALSDELKRLEIELGRKHDGSGVVAIDIDLLAQHASGCWRPEPHALAKGEFDRAACKALLQQAGQRVCSPAGR